LKANNIMIDKLKGCRCVYEKLSNGTNVLVQACNVHRQFDNRAYWEFTGITVNDLAKRFEDISNVFKYA
jgi:hypothetical protein